MREVKVKKNDLLGAVRKNRESHAALLEKAVEGYRKKWMELLERTISDMRSGGNVQTILRLPVPQDHRADYDRIIRMLEMTVEDEVVLSALEFSQYVMDEWEWRQISDMSNFAYATGEVPEV